MKKISLIIPARNEEICIEQTIRIFHNRLNVHGIFHEILVINDGSIDKTESILDKLSKEIKELNLIKNDKTNGFGLAIRKGLENFQGDYVAIVMADNSDDPDDLIKYIDKINEGFDCVFGSRFIKGGKTIDYPPIKYLLNRLTNNIIKLLFGIRYNDTTNAFKLYRRDTIVGLKPFLSHHFNLTVELPLKSIVRGYSYAIVPNSWKNLKHRKSNLSIKESGSRYFFIILYCLLEKWLSKGDYTKDIKET